MRRLILGAFICFFAVGFSLSCLDMSEQAEQASPRKILFESNIGGNMEVFVINSDGTDPINLSHRPGYDGTPSWSADGSRIIFSSDRDAGAKRGNDVYIMNADGTNVQRITTDSKGYAFPTLSPDSRWIAFDAARDSENPQVWIMSVDGSNMKRLTFSDTPEGYCSWTADSRRIGFDTFRDGHSEIYTINADGSDPFRITHFEAHVGDPRISPNGQQLAFETGKDGNSEIYVINLDGSDPKRLTNNPADDRSPAISDDGKQVVFSSDRDGEREQFELFIMDIDGSNLRKIETPGAVNLYPTFAPERIKVLIIDGINNHDWEKTTAAAKATLEQTGRFEVDVSTSPRKKAPAEEWQAWRPIFSNYQVVVSNYNDDWEEEKGETLWSEETKADFERFVREGGGFVPIHAADNASADWVEYNEMIGLGGWGGREAGKSGYLLRLIDGTWQATSPNEGASGDHGPEREFLVVHDQPEHPILRGLPTEWMHAKDELYASMRGPAKNIEVLAHSYSLFTKENEPVLMLITYGKGQVFHIALGHYNDESPPFGVAVHCVGFQTVLARGTEYVATGRVTIGFPDSFPGKEKPAIVAPNEVVW